ncbi:(2Fe-2S)-binding protein [Parapusillimonas granuli]|uniref:(2Fe-2S)-binding protein n=1 Tax=Parapusillimonas granuli TaxID=380911 RepID=A0A853FYE1_9BURK|nr:(2Fe-2S)-binding protein [Parapusillimonas granuli]MBB5213857.1 putative molibdopterin-dependent oxidoreductase YjgC [Parapusillimonas granuli]MCZ2089398.1 (2Fe-2S)-binding protein [Burkholderiales bacterium]MEB2398936.1 (2Fe-2S)-binding protein [Alcaligenaceae bacterium]NYT48692.1 (2Fe-2S)-binding protein [Parapusillimonas granuli]
MFTRLAEAQQAVAQAPVAVTINGEPVQCRAGDTVAAALFAAGFNDCRDTAVREAPRGPFCMMGVCYDCLVVIDGRPNQQGCMIPVRSGMNIERQHGAREVEK